MRKFHGEKFFLDLYSKLKELITGVPSIEEIDRFMMLLWRAGILENFESEKIKSRSWKIHPRYKDMSEDERLRDMFKRLEDLEN